jgi:hypothetical protein
MALSATIADALADNASFSHARNMKYAALTPKRKVNRKMP